MQNLAPQSLPLKPNHVIIPNFGFWKPISLSFRRTLNWKCRSSREENAINSSGGGDLEGSLSGIVGEQVEELLSREENKGLLDGLERASMRVEVAKRELADIERQEIEAKLLQDYVNRLETRASEIAECQQEIIAARSKIEEAERSLSLAENVIGESTENSDPVGRNMERLESAKAAVVAAVIGTTAELPMAISQASSLPQLILPLGIAFVSCALFGVTFRYAVRRDLDNVHLKTGTVAAFGFVKGLGMLSVGPPLELSWESLGLHALDGAVLVSQSVLIFAFASVALDFCCKMRLLKPFPSSSQE